MMDCSHEDYTILKRRGRQITARCNDCGEVVTWVREKRIPVPIVINRHESSERTTVMLERDRVVILDEVLDVEGEDVEVHAIEVGNKRVDREQADAIDCIWGVSLSFPQIVGVSVHLPERTLSYKVAVERDRWFGVGDVLQIGMITFKVTSLITERGKRKKAAADEIKRIYGTPTTMLAEEMLEVYHGV
ncbi:MAG TPA: hypothetical protein ENN11_01490 [Methanomicrobia archaeon]|nr:hypothetical protein [Methanomicrobia archaeon]